MTSKATKVVAAWIRHPDEDADLAEMIKAELTELPHDQVMNFCAITISMQLLTIMEAMMHKEVKTE